jgi:hypothetical protein
MSDKNSGFLGKIISLATSPRGVFTGIEELDLRGGIAVILIIGILSGWAGMTYFSKAELQIPDMGPGSGGGPPGFGPGPPGSSGFDPAALRSRLAPFIAIGGVLGSVTRWLVPSILVLFVANIRLGKGSSKRMLAMTGFASAPRIIQQFLRVFDAYTISVADIASLTASRAAASGLLGKLVNQVFTVFNLFGVLTIVLTAIAVSVNYEATPRKASYVTVLAYVVYMILRVYLPII